MRACGQAPKGMERAAITTVRPLGTQLTPLSPLATAPQLAVRQLNLAIEKGECFGLLGPNGAGKSTSINMMVRRRALAVHA